MATTRAMLERRRASRVPIHALVTVLRDEADGEPAETPAVALGVSRCGALLRVPFCPEIGSRIRVLNELSREIREFRVIRVGEAKRDGTREIGVEILYPTRNFWGVRFPDDSAEEPAAGLQVHQFPGT
jgi:hypothetical protein